jgi:hypothetical protein
MFLETLAGYVICILVALFGLAVLWRVLTGAIDVRGLISESTGTASMSRFQLLIFTFVISLSFFFVTVANVKIAQARNEPPKTSQSPTAATTSQNSGPEIPDIPGGVLAVLGISASSFLVSKGIQSGKDTELQRLRVAGPQEPMPPAPPATPTTLVK